MASGPARRSARHRRLARLPGSPPHPGHRPSRPDSRRRHDLDPGHSAALGAPLLGADRDLLADLAVFRAATGVAAEDTRIAGAEQFADRARAEQTRLESRAAAIIGRPDTETGRYNDLIDSINPHIRRDPYWPHLAAHLATAARTGVNIHHLVTTAADQGPLPDELPAAALWWRISGTLSPAALDTATSGLRPVWLPDLSAVFGTALAETIVSDAAFPALASAVAAVDPRRWTPLDLLGVAAEHLADAGRRMANPIRPDEYARLITYSIDLFTTGSPYERDRDDDPLVDEPPMSPDEEEELHHRHPDPAAAAYPPPPGPIDFDRDDDALLVALGIDPDEVPLDDETLPPTSTTCMRRLNRAVSSIPARCCPKSGCVPRSMMSTGCATAAPNRPPPLTRSPPR